MGIFDEAKMVVFRDKEVKSIIRTRDDAVIYEKITVPSLDYIQLTIVGQIVGTYNHYESFQPNNNIYIDWGDGSPLENYSSYEENPYMDFGHYYQTSGTYTVKIYGNITTLGGGCFGSVEAMTEAILPERITEIGFSAFGNCTNLQSVNIPSGVTVLSEACFGWCSNLSSISLPNGLTTIEDECFRLCTSLTSIVIPNNVTSIGKECFFECSNLESVVLSNNITEIPDDCFYKCSNLASINIPNGITTIGEDCFSDCYNLASIILPESITTLRQNCFGQCTSLTSIIIPQNVTTIEDFAFGSSTNLENIEFQWDISNDIISYRSNWFYNINNFTITIPYGTTQLYIDKNYPLEKLVERENPYTSSTVRVRWTGPSGSAPVLMSLAYAFKDNMMVSRPYDDNIYELNPNNNWELTINNLPKQINEQDVVYKWWVDSLPNDYKGVQPVYNWNESNYDPTQNLTIIYLQKK